VVVRIAALRDLPGLNSARDGDVVLPGAASARELSGLNSALVAGAASAVVSPFLGLFPRILSVYWRVSGDWNLYEHPYCVSAYHMLLVRTRFLASQSVYDPRDVCP